MPWWGGSYVIARRNSKGAYCQANTYWRLAKNDHEAQMGLEEITDDEPVWLPLTAKEFDDRTKLKNQNDRRMFDIHVRMLMRCGQKPIQPDAEYVRVESTPFPADWRPMQASMKAQAQN